MRCSVYTVERESEEQQGEGGRRETSESTLFPSDGKMWEIFWAPGVFGLVNVLFEQGILVAKPDVMIY